MLQSRRGEYDAVSRNNRRAAAIAVAGVFAVAPLVSACAAGQHPQSALPTQLNEGVNASAHLVDIRNAFLLGPAAGQKLAAGDSAPLYAWFVNNAASADRLVAVEASGVAQSVEIAGGALNLPPSRLITTVQPPAATPQSPSTPPSLAPSPTATKAKTHPAKPRRTAGAGRSPKVTVTPTPGAPTPGASGSSAPAGAPPVAPPSTSSKVILRGLTKAYSGGETVRLTLRFQQAGTISLNIPVVPRNGYYGTYSPAPALPTPSATPPPAPPTAADKSKTQKARTHKTKARQGTSKSRPSATPTA
jgi:copper(I)-binding protein